MSDDDQAKKDAADLVAHFDQQQREFEENSARYEAFVEKLVRAILKELAK